MFHVKIKSISFHFDMNFQSISKNSFQICISWSTSLPLDLLDKQIASYLLNLLLYVELRTVIMTLAIVSATATVQ